MDGREDGAGLIGGGACLCCGPLLCCARGRLPPPAATGARNERRCLPAHVPPQMGLLGAWQVLAQYLPPEKLVKLVKDMPEGSLVLLAGAVEGCMDKGGKGANTWPWPAWEREAGWGKHVLQA